MNTRPPSSPRNRFPFLAARLARDHHLGLPLTAGILVALCAAGLFALVAVHALAPGALPRFDQHIADWIHLRATPGLTRFFLVITHWHSTIGILLMSALLALWMRRRRAWTWLLVLAVSVPGGMLLNYVLKHLFQRIRPQFEQPIIVLHSYSFPSGHTVSTVLFYSILAAWLMGLPGNAQRRWRIALAATLLSLLVGLSRIYLGAHYVSDVIAAMLEGLSWASLWITIIFTARRHHSARSLSN